MQDQENPNAPKWRAIKSPTPAIPDNFFDGYLISDQGEIRRRFDNGVITPRLNDWGVWIVTLGSRLGAHKRSSFKVHRLVATTFVPNPHGWKFVRFIDEDDNNCAATNLAWANARRSRITQKELDNILRMHDIGKTIVQIMTATGYSRSTIYKVLRQHGKTNRTAESR